MLATLDSLLSVDFDLNDIGRRMLAWFDDGAYTPDGDGRYDVGGSLMRILPVALVLRCIPRAELVEDAEVVSRITHQHRLSQTVCAVYVVVARHLLEGAAPSDALASTLTDLRADWVAWPRPESIAQLGVLEAYRARSGRGFVVDSFWSAWDAFVGASSYEDTIDRAIRYGHDTDTTAAIAGGLAGIHWGVEAIPAPWIKGMRGHALVDPLVAQLTATAT
jgi:ADP-ribosylglycohydrolase